MGKQYDCCCESLSFNPARVTEAAAASFFSLSLSLSFSLSLSLSLSLLSLRGDVVSDVNFCARRKEEKEGGKTEVMPDKLRLTLSHSFNVLDNLTFTHGNLDSLISLDAPSNVVRSLFDFVELELFKKSFAFLDLFAILPPEGRKTPGLEKAKQEREREKEREKEKERRRERRERGESESVGVMKSSQLSVCLHYRDEKAVPKEIFQTPNFFWFMRKNKDLHLSEKDAKSISGP